MVSGFVSSVAIQPILARADASGSAPGLDVRAMRVSEPGNTGPQAWWSIMLELVLSVLYCPLSDLAKRFAPLSDSVHPLWRHVPGMIGYFISPALTSRI